MLELVQELLRLDQAIPKTTSPPTPEVQPPTAIPSWIKNNAGWWARWFN